MERKDRDTYVLSTGREINANHGLISIAADVAAPLGYGADYAFAGFEMCEGYDGSHDVDDWTLDELAELTDFMIDQWRLFLAAACQKHGHQFSRWTRGSSMDGKSFSKMRMCRHCRASEEQEISAAEYHAP